MAIFHGLNSHVGHAAHIANELAGEGIITVGFDHRGFGQSEGERGYIESLAEHLHDAEVFMGMVKAQYPHLPIFCMGQSMGGMTCYFLALKHRELMEGAILLAPAIKNHMPSGVARVICGISSMLPKTTRLLPHRLGYSTKNPQVEEDILHDEFAFNGRASFRAIEVLLRAMNEAPATFPEFSAPLVVVQGGLDKLVNPDGSFELIEKARSTDKQVPARRLSFGSTRTSGTTSGTRRRSPRSPRG